MNRFASKYYPPHSEPLSLTRDALCPSRESEFAFRPFDILARSLLLEKEITLKVGKYQLSKALKMYRLEDRIAFIISNFSSAAWPPKEYWWSDLAAGTVLRNALVHPKDEVDISYVTVERGLKSILECLNYLYQAVFHKAHPSYNRAMHSELIF
jgi:hypothetical protein